MLPTMPSPLPRTLELQYLLYVNRSSKDRTVGLGTTSGKHWIAPPHEQTLAVKRRFRLPVFARSGA